MKVPVKNIDKRLRTNDDYPLRIVIIIVLALTSFFSVFVIKRVYLGTRIHPTGREDFQSPCERLICMSPGITETVFALGLGDHVVGVTRYCLYPPEAQRCTVVGGFLDPSLETLIALRPSRVLCTQFHRELFSELERLTLSYEIIVQDTIEDVRNSFLHVGRLCGRENAAMDLLTSFDARIARVTERVQHLPKYTVLMTTGRDIQSGVLNEIYAVGTGSFLSDLLALAGGNNCIFAKVAEYPALSVEGILQLNPEVIIEFGPEIPEGTEEKVLAAWRSLPGLSAVIQNRLYYIGGTQYTIPGPRIPETLEVLATCLHGNIS